MRHAFGVLAFASVLLAVPEAAVAQSGAYGYAIGGLGAAQCANGCASIDPVYDQVGLIGGGFAYPISRGRLWIAGDVNSRIVNGYFDASGGPAAVVSLLTRQDHQLQLFAQAGPRWGDGGNVRWNAGVGVNVFSRGHLGLRVEYQYQWENWTFADQAFGPSGPVGPPVYSSGHLNEHFFRAGIAIR